MGFKTQIILAATNLHVNHEVFLFVITNFSEATSLVKYKKITIIPPKKIKIRATLSQFEKIIPKKTLMAPDEATKSKAITKGWFAIMRPKRDNQNLNTLNSNIN